ncbi:hypothetical protein H4R34_006174, partial [Dimargaris verticillata]
AIEAQYLTDPTVSDADKKQYRELLQSDSPAAQAMFKKYFQRRQQFRRDHGLPLIPSEVDPPQQHIAADVVLDMLKDGVDKLSTLYRNRANLLLIAKSVTDLAPLGSSPYPEFFAGLPRVSDTERQILTLWFERSIHYQFPGISEVNTGYLGAVNNGYVMDIPALVEKFLKVINQPDFFLIIKKSRDKVLYGQFANHIARNNPDRARYLFHDIVAFQVIPELIAAHVAKGYHDQVLVFIKSMLKNHYLLEFWERTPIDTSLNFYVRPVCMEP